MCWAAGNRTDQGYLYARLRFNGCSNVDTWAPNVEIPPTMCRSIFRAPAP